MTTQIMPLRTTAPAPLDISGELRPVQAKINAVSQIEQLATYHAALELVARIDDDLTRHGILLTCLDEVVRELLEVEPND